MAPTPLRVLIADDSPLFAQAIASIVTEDPSIAVVGMAHDGREAVEMTARLSPHVITMDIHMPVLDGLAAIEQIMATTPTPILVMTSDPGLDAGNLGFQALQRGALEAMAKPAQWFLPAEDREALRSKLRLLAEVPVVRHTRWRQTKGGLPAVRPGQRGPSNSRAQPALRCQVIGVVGSTGGPGALADILCALPSDYPLPILVVQHLSEGFAPSLVGWLANISPLCVRLACDGDRITPKTVHVAPDSRHMTVTANGTLCLTESPPISGHRPSGTVLLSSLARAYGRNAAGVILTGMGNDGVAGLREMRDQGSVTLAQDEESSVVYGMPKEALRSGAAQRALSLIDIPAALITLAYGTAAGVGIRRHG